MELLMAILSVTFIDIILGGDNAVVIALASRELPPREKKRAILWGGSLAVILRVLLVIIATYLLTVPYLQFVGGLALIYIGYNLLAGDECEEIECEASDNLWKAVQTIVVADFIMSLDNVLALAGIAHGNWLVLLLGLAISVPFIIVGAQFLSNLMAKWPLLVYIGAGLIAYTASEMLVDDVKIGPHLEPYALMINVGVTAGVLALGYWTHKQNEKSNIEAVLTPEGTIYAVNVDPKEEFIGQAMVVTDLDEDQITRLMEMFENHGLSKTEIENSEAYLNEVSCLSDDQRRQVEDMLQMYESFLVNMHQG